VQLPPEAARTLLSYRFPLNIRELEAWLKTPDFVAAYHVASRGARVRR
jgi:transcriptional regulator with GAF, ATPase, and Fis domain